MKSAAEGSIASAEGAAPGSRSAITVLLCMLVAVVEGFDIQAIGIAAPRLAPELGLSAGALGWIFSFGNVGFVVGAGIPLYLPLQRSHLRAIHGRSTGAFC